MAAAAEWGAFEYAIIAGIPTVIGGTIGGLISLSWGMIKHRIKSIDERVKEANNHIGEHYSRIHNLETKTGEIDEKIEGRNKLIDERHQEIKEKLDAMRVEMRTDKQRLEDKFELLLKELSTKIDTMNDRRNQPRGP